MPLLQRAVVRARTRVVMSQIMARLFSLLSKGYLPREVPPPFTSRPYALALRPAVNAIPNDFVQAKRTGKLMTHNIARVGRLRRNLGTPNPIHYFRLARFLEHEWPTLSAHFARSRLSVSTPRRFRNAPRALLPAFSDRSLDRLTVGNRTNARYIVRTDIAQFYSSIYTHSIPWALHGKTYSKANRRATNQGNTLDGLCTRAQDDETIGIPIGPDTSLAISEVILAAADVELRQRLPQLRGFRRVDDYELRFDSEREAEEGLHVLESVLREYGLRLNSSKTRVLALPQPFEKPWVIELRRFTFRGTPRTQGTDIMDYFSRAFDLAASHPGDFVLNYALARLRSVTVFPQNWLSYLLLLLQAAAAEPGTLHYVFGEVAKHVRAGRKPPLAALERTLNALIQQAAPTGNGSEVAWAIWAALVFKVQIHSAAAASLSRMRDNIVALLALDALARGLVPTGLNVSSWASVMNAQSLDGPDWLLAYEANAHGWLPNAAGVDFVSADPCYGYLKRNGVRFYDPARVSLAMPARAIGITVGTRGFSLPGGTE